MKSIRFFRSVVGMSAALSLAGAAVAQTVTATLTTPTASYSAAGGTVTLTASISYSTQPTALGGLILLPAGWSLASTGGANVPSVVPEPGTTEQLEYAYTSFPAGSAQFTVTLNYPPGLSGNQTITSGFQYRTPTLDIVPDPVVIAPALSAIQAMASRTLTAGAAATSFTPVTGANGSPPYTYSISPSLSSGLALNAATGAITGTPAAAVAARTYTVTVSDSTAATASNTFSLTINSALTSTQAIPSKSLTVDTAAAPFTPVTASGGSSPITYEINPALPAGLSLNPSNGSISGTPTVTAAATTHTVAITDTVGAMTSKTFSLTVNPAPVATQAVPSMTLTAGTATVAFTPVTVSGGTAPYTYAVSPALPTNLVLNSTTGAVTGTPVAAVATAMHTVTITDSAGATASNTFDLTVNGTVVANPNITSHALTAGAVAIPFTPVTPAGGTAPYTFAISPALSSGLTFNTSTGAISGTPAAALAARNYTVTVTDSVGATANRTFSLTINASLGSSVAVASKALTLNTPTAAFTPVTVSGGTPAYDYAIDPALPAGLSLSPTTGSISGTPTVIAAAASYTITITDHVGATTGKSFNLTVNPVLVATQSVPGATFTAGTAAAAFTPVSGSGGTSPYAFAVSPALPSGLAMNSSTGSVSGTPTAASASNVYTVTITDAAGATASHTFAITVNGPVSATKAIASKVLTAGAPAVPFTPVIAAGGTAPYGFSILPALPSGMAIDPTTGAITGTPAAGKAATTHTVTVTDSSGATAGNTFSLTVNGPVVASQAVVARSLTAGTAAVAFTPVTGSSGTLPYTYSVSPALPPSLAFNSATGAVTGTPAAASGPSIHTVTITDSVGASASNTFSLTVNVALAADAGTIASRTLTRSAAAAPFTPLPLTGGTPPYTWSVAPSLPTGLTLNASTGVISGTPSAALAATSFTITGRDSVGAQVTHSLSLVVNAALTATQAIATRTLSAGTVAVAFTPVTAAGGTGPYTFAIAPALPADLTLDPATGAISGTPGAALTATAFTVTITDAVGATASRAFSLTVNGPLTAMQLIAAKSLTAATPAVAFAPVTGVGGTPPYAYAITPALPSGLALSSTTGSISGTTAAALAAMTFTVVVTDNAAATASSTFSLTVNPALTTTQAIPSKALTAGVAVVAFTPVTCSGGTTPYVYSVSPALPSGLTLSTSTGAITGTAAGAVAARNYTVTVTDGVGATGSKTFNLTVNAGLSSAVAVASRALTVNTPAVAFTPVTVSGGTMPYVYGVNPALPAGLSLNTLTGSILGTPTVAAAAASFTVTITDSVGATTGKAFNLTVNPALVATQAVASRTFTAGTAAAPFSPVTASGGTVSYSFAVTPALPPGLTMSASTGSVSGTPSAASGLTTYTVTVTDAAGATAAATFAIEVNGPVSANQAIATKALTAGTEAMPFAPVTAAGGTAPYAFSISPALPTGLSLDGSSGVIAGTPAASSAARTHTITVTDSSGATASRTFTLTVNTGVTATQAVASRSLTAGTALQPFTPVTGSGGTPPYTYSVSPALPASLTLNATTGAISGTAASSSGSVVHTVTITDSVGASASNTFSLTVNVALAADAGTIASRTLTRSAAAAPFTPLPLTGGTPPYTWSVAPSLPTGLTLNASTGVISGTPSAALAATSFTITGRDSVGAQVTHSLSLVVNAALTATQAIATRTLSAGTVAVVFTPVTAAGGTGPYTFAIAPALPADLTIDPATGAISGGPNAALATTTFTVTVTDAVGATASRTFTLTVNGPLTATQVVASKALTAGTAAVAFAPVSGAGGTAPYTYAVAPSLPATLVFNSTTGGITGTPDAQLAATVFTITVNDSVAATASNTFSLTVNPALATTQAVAAKAVSAGAVAESFTPVTAADGTPPYTFAIAPALPAALVLNPTTGAISGTPTAAMAAKTFTITATDSVGATSNKSFSLAVNGAPTAVAGQTIASRVLTAGTAAVSFVPLPVTGGTPPFIYSVNPALPAGLTLDPATGAITGTAVGPAASVVHTITATDASGAQVNHSLTLIVNAAPVATAVIPSRILLQNVVAEAFTPVTVAGGTPPFTYSISPALPAGLAVSPSTGAISGTPTAATDAVVYNITATDSVGAPAAAAFTLKINRGPAITTQPTASPSYLVGGTLTLNVVANGSPMPTYQWRKGGEPVVGNASATTAAFTISALQLSDAGTYDVLVTNEAGSVASSMANVMVYQPPAITTHPTSQTITAGEDATFSVVATGDPAPTYQWRRNGAALPGATAATLTLTAVPLNGGGAITVVVSNPGGSVTSNSATLTVNPVAPVFAAGLPATATAVQDRNFFFPVAINNTVATFSATGLAGPGGTLAVNAENGSLSGVPANIGTFVIAITATNTTGSATHNLSLTVQAPPPVITSAAAAGGRVDSPFSFTVVGTHAPTSYAASNLPPGLSIDSVTGVISGTPSAAGTYTVGLVATNAAGSVNQPLVITIEPPLNAPVYTGTTTPSGTQGVAFSFTPAFGAVTAPYALAGTLPAGLVFVPETGAITGTPTETGSFPVTLSATNAGGTTSVPLTIMVNPAPSAPVITSASTAPAARVGASFSFTLTSSGTPAASSYNATGLPPGLVLDGATGAITGTPTTFGTYKVTVTATNTVGTGPASILSISVAPSASAPVITSAPVAPGQVGQPFSYTLTGSNSPTSFQITSGALPAGLSLNATSGAITGTPLAAAVGETRVWFNATSGSGEAAVSGLSLEVLFAIAPAAAAPVVTSNGTATAQVGQPFQYAITASSSTPITGYAATGRPAWLALDPTTGLMTGIPSEATTSPISIVLTATNSGGTGNPKMLLLTVEPAPATPVITSALSANGRVGTAFSYQISASESPTSYVAADLPTGLVLDPATGAIAGTPTVSNSFDVTLRAANGAGMGAPAILQLEIAPAADAPTITSAAAASAQVGVAFSYQIVATNGPILSYAVTGTLPDGLLLNTSTGAIKGTPADDPRGYTVQLTATNAEGTSLPQPLAIALAPALGVPSLTTPLYVSGTVGVEFSFTITATNLAGSAPYDPPIALDAVNLPPGLAVNPSTGVIQGVPTRVGRTVATLSAMNSAGVGPTRDLTFEIQPAPAAPVIAGAGTAVGQVGQSFGYQIVASNAPLSYEVLGAPAWMSLNGSSGAITGTPTVPGNITVQLLASNAVGTSSPTPLAISIAPAANTPVVTSSRTQTGTVGTPLSFTVEVSPALPAPTFVASGLPGGLSLDPTTGVISGTPNISGTFNVTITPANSSGVGAPVVIVVTILPNVIFGG